MTYNQSDYCQKNDKSNDSTYIVNNPSHRKVLLIVLLNLIIVNINAVVKMFLRQFLLPRLDYFTLTEALRVFDSLYGLKSI